MNKFVFDPPNGLLDKNIFPSNPQTEDAARGQFMQLFNQIKGYLNDDIGTSLGKFDDKYISSDSDNGFQTLPSGLIIQWGTAVALASGYNAYLRCNYRKTFPNKVFTVVLSSVDNTRVFSTIQDSNTFGFTARLNVVMLAGESSHSGIGAVRVNYISVGY